MTIMEALYMLDSIIDESDPDVSVGVLGRKTTIVLLVLRLLYSVMKLANWIT